MSQAIMDQALELGRRISESAEFKAVQEKEKNMLQDEAAQKLLKEFQELQQKNQQKQMQGKQITPEDIKEFEAMELKMLENPFIKDFSEAQNAFQNLLNTVNQTINKAMLSARDEQQQCTSCSTCSPTGDCQ
ncbi:YlbF family regulator [Desulfofalx alkaliphila]|uniref:YlbF family regulator n=1 Tax=Desulfofalx alkaliphila TaxID=105483 RepID=UPI00054CF946|nr:YlbF family regulator [Desulfofalx alkaliphila]